MNRAGILGLGLWVPDTVRTNEAWPPSFRAAFLERRSARRDDFTDLERGEVDRPYEQLYARHAARFEDDPFRGAIERRVESPDVPTVVGDARAAVRALEDASVDPREVDLVLSSALVPDRVVPSNGPSIQHLAGCVNAAGLGFESVCSSAVSQLEIAAGLVESGRAKLVLCVQSHQIARTNALDMPGSPLFGDASAAFLVGPAPADRGLVRVVRAGDGALAGAVTFAYRQTPGAAWWRDAAGPVHPGSDDLASARQLARNMLAYAILTIQDVCRREQMPIDAAAAFAMIQPLVWYQAAVADGLGVPSERAPSTHSLYAHIGAAAVVANLLQARRSGLLRDGSPVVLFAHGAGITRYAALLRWHGRCS